MPLLESLIVPVLTLTAKNMSGETVSTVVSSNEASFLIGVFSNNTLVSADMMANDAVNMQVDLLNAGQIAFVLPGVQLLIFPIGLVMTTAWFAIGLAVYGFGTVQRMHYRSSFRSRLAAQGREVKI